MCVTPLFAVPDSSTTSKIDALSPMTPIISVHLVDRSVGESLRRKAPDPATVAGLRSAHKIVAAPFSGRHIARPQVERGGIVAFWEDVEALDDFVLWHPLASDLNRGWMLRMQPLTASGAWNGLRVAVPDQAAVDHTGPTAALTIGLVKPTRFVGLQKRNVQIERQLLRSPGFVWGTALAGPPRLLATLSIWESSQALTAFARHGAHLDGVRASVPKSRVPGQPAFVDGTTYFDEAAFVRCRPFAATGHLSGRNPMPCLELPATPILEANGGLRSSLAQTMSETERSGVGPLSV